MLTESVVQCNTTNKDHSYSREPYYDHCYAMTEHVSKQDFNISGL